MLLKIYNNWGEKIFNNLDAIEEGWDAKKMQQKEHTNWVIFIRDELEN